MATNPPNRQAPTLEKPIIDRLLDSDPSIRWQVMRDLIGASADQVAVERARVTTEGMGAQLLALQRADGRWLNTHAFEAFAPNSGCSLRLAHALLG